jgi:hypothetical protein
MGKIRISPSHLSLTDIQGVTTSNALIYDRPNVMFVEGIDDALFVKTQIEICGNPDLWHLIYLGGVDQDWKLSLQLLLKSIEFSKNGNSIAIMRDADKDLVSANSMISSVFTSNGFPDPVNHAQVYLAPSGVKIGKFVLPDGTSPGELEDLLLLAIPDANRKQMAEDYIGDVIMKFVPLKKESKGKLHAYLAGQEKFVNTIGLAMHKPPFAVPPNSRIFDPFRNFVSGLE